MSRSTPPALPCIRLLREKSGITFIMPILVDILSHEKRANNTVQLVWAVASYGAFVAVAVPFLVIKHKKYIDDFVMFEDTYARVQPSINNGSLTISCFVTRETFTPDTATTKDEQDKIPHDMETVIGRPDLKQLVFDFCSGSGTVGMTSKSAAISAIFSGHNNARCRDHHCSLRPYCVHDGRE